MSTLYIWPEAWAQGPWPGQYPDWFLLESKLAHNQHASLLRQGNWEPRGRKGKLLNLLLSWVWSPRVWGLLVAHGRAEGVLSFHCLRAERHWGAGLCHLSAAAFCYSCRSCVDIASKHLSTPQLQESWICASPKRNLSVTDQAEVSDTVDLTVWMVGKWRHKHWFRPKSNTECKPGLSRAQLTSYFTLPRKQSRN